MRIIIESLVRVPLLMHVQMQAVQRIVVRARRGPDHLVETSLTMRRPVMINQVIPTIQAMMLSVRV